MTILSILGLLGLILGLAYVRAKLLIWVVAMGLLTALYVLLPQINVGVVMVNSVITAGLILLCITPLRRRLISDHFFKWFKKVLPSLSRTEQEALEAGTVWWDGELFSGTPDWSKLLTVPKPQLSPADIQTPRHLLEQRSVAEFGARSSLRLIAPSSRVTMS